MRARRGPAPTAPSRARPGRHTSRAPNSAQRPQVCGPRRAPARPRLPRRGPPAEAGGQRRGSRGGGRAAPAQAPLFVSDPPSSRRRADAAGPGGPRRPGRREPPSRQAFPAAHSAARLRPDDPRGSGDGGGGGDPPPARSARLLRALPPPPALLPDRAVSPPRGRPRPARAGRGPRPTWGRPGAAAEPRGRALARARAPPAGSGTRRLGAASRTARGEEDSSPAWTCPRAGWGGVGWVTRVKMQASTSSPWGLPAVLHPLFCLIFLSQQPSCLATAPLLEAFPRHSQQSRPGVRQKK
jgi:hypothetical protein